MSNHYHLLLETSEANLAREMGWLQNAYTRRINTRHRLWGHLSGGRYKAILVEAGNCFWALLDYIHLNLCGRDWSTTARGSKPLAGTAWQPISDGPAGGRSGWRPRWDSRLSAARTARPGGESFLVCLRSAVDWRKPSHAGLSFPVGDGKPDLEIHSALRRGWLFGFQAFRERMLRFLARNLALGGKRREDGYRGAEIRDHDIQRADSIIAVGCKTLKVSLEKLQRGAKSDWRKTLLAELVQSQTVMSLEWIRGTLNMGDRSTCCRLIRQARQELPECNGWKAMRAEILRKTTGMNPRVRHFITEVLRVSYPPGETTLGPWLDDPFPDYDTEPVVAFSAS
jgi:REP-associated tyrosine transposase